MNRRTAVAGGLSFAVALPAAADDNPAREVEILAKGDESSPTPHFFQNRKQQGSRCLVLHAPDLGAHDTTLIEGHPEHEVPEELNYPGYQREDAPGDGAPGGR